MVVCFDGDMVLLLNQNSELEIRNSEPETIRTIGIFEFIYSNLKIKLLKQ
jgi:hypothetical protein